MAKSKYYKLSEKASLYVDPSNPNFVIRNNEVIKMDKPLSKEAQGAFATGHIREASEEDYEEYISTLTGKKKKTKVEEATSKAKSEPDEDEEEDEEDEDSEEEEEDEEEGPEDWSKTRLIDEIRAEESIPEDEKKGLTNKSKEDLVSLYTKYVK